MVVVGLRVLLIVMLLATGGALVAVHDRDEGPAAVQPVAAAARKTSFECRGLDRRRQVRGENPTYTRKRLATYPNHRRLCRAVWLPEPRRYFVPQGVAVLGRTAWVSGYRYRKGYGQRPCQLMRISLVTGRRVAFHSAIFGRVGKRPRTYCRHGGGIVQRGSYLWIVEKNKLWQVDPSPKRRVLTARRVWRLQSPVRGSAVVLRPGRIGLVPFVTRGPAYIHWFSFRALLRPRVLDLGTRGQGRKRLGAVARTRVPTYVQGATTDARGRLYLARSTLACGELVTPAGTRLGYVPGAEGLQFSPRRKRLYAISESGARPYVKSRKPLTAGVNSFEWPGLSRGRGSGCRFPP